MNQAHDKSFDEGELTGSSAAPPTRPFLSPPLVPPDPGDDLVTVVTCPTEFEASTKVAVLEEAGIDAFVFGAVHAALPLGQKLLAVPVQVRAADLEQAKAALSENRANAPSIDWDSVDIGEREDNLPLGQPGRMPWPAKIGFALAMIVLGVMLAGVAWGAFGAMFSRW